MKRFIALLFSILIIAACTVFTSAYEGENYVKFSSSSDVDFPVNQHIAGDANGDGTVSLLDVITAMKYLSGDTSSSLRDSIDINSDGSVTLTDAMLLLKHIVGDEVGLGELVG